MIYSNAEKFEILFGEGNVCWQLLRLRTSQYPFSPAKVSLAERIVKEYAGLSKEGLTDAITRIKDSLGGLATREALEALVNGEFHTIARQVLVHYDRLYSKSLTRRIASVAYRLPIIVDDPIRNATALIQLNNTKCY